MNEFGSTITELEKSDDKRSQRRRICQTSKWAMFERLGPDIFISTSPFYVLERNWKGAVGGGIIATGDSETACWFALVDYLSHGRGEGSIPSHESIKAVEDYYKFIPSGNAAVQSLKPKTETEVFCAMAMLLENLNPEQKQRAVRAMQALCGTDLEASGLIQIRNLTNDGKDYNSFNVCPECVVEAIRVVQSGREIPFLVLGSSGNSERHCIVCGCMCVTIYWVAAKAGVFKRKGTA